MDENHQRKANHNPATTEDIDWIISKKSKLLIPRHKNQTKVIQSWTGFSSKTLWDWLQLLIVPFILAGGGFWFTAQQNQTSLQTAAVQQQEATLDSYLSFMSGLLLDKNLRGSRQDDEVRIVARSETLTTLPRLDPQNKWILLQFLYESDLIDIYQSGSYNFNNAIISLDGADLSEIKAPSADIGSQFVVIHTWMYLDLSFTNLSYANLSYASFRNSAFNGANLSHANLSYAGLNGSFLDGAVIINSDLDHISLTGSRLLDADLDGSNLSSADLSGVDFTNTELEGVDFTNANLKGSNISSEQLAQAASLKNAIMPDGSIHP